MTVLSPGFGDPVAEAQACFRAVLDAMSRPGSRHVVSAPAGAPARVDRATAAVLLTLVDAECRLWVAPRFAAAVPWILFHCGATRVEAIGEADFVLTDELPDLAGLACGSDEGPEEAATVILQVAGLDGAAWRLEGPGLAAPVRFGASLPADFAQRWAANHALFPRGVDLILCAGDGLAALPRSVRVEG